MTYNAAGQVSAETDTSLRGTDLLQSVVTNSFGTGAGYALGAVTQTVSNDYKRVGNSWQSQGTTTTTNTMAWWDGAVTGTSTANKSGTLTTTTYTYGNAGMLASISVGSAVSVTFTNDLNGQAIRRDTGASAAPGANGPHEIWYRYGGKEVGYTGNNGTLDTDYTDSLTERRRSGGTGAFRNGATTFTAFADFDQSLAQINSYAQGGAGGSYEVHAGDTLGSIAAGLWGDSSLWYKLAEANGLGANAGLVEGQRLSVPSGVMKNTHNATTFNPYDPSEVIGDVGPAPTPAAKKNKCGMFGTVLSLVVAAVVTAFLPPIAPGLGPVLGSMVQAAAVSTISQGIGVAVGYQDKFSFKGVAVAALSAGVSAGLGQIGQKMGNFLSSSTGIAGAARNVLSEGITQGIATAVGLQDKFDWAGVAAAGLGSLASDVAGHAFGGAIGKIDSGLLRDGARAALTITADSITSAAARSIITGTSFGDNVVAVLPSVIGRTIGAMITGEIGRVEARRAAERTQEAIQVTPGGLDASGSRFVRNLLPSIELPSFDLPTLDLSGLPVPGYAGLDPAVGHFLAARDARAALHASVQQQILADRPEFTELAALSLQSTSNSTLRTDVGDIHTVGRGVNYVGTYSAFANASNADWNTWLREYGSLDTDDHLNFQFDAIREFSGVDQIQAHILPVLNRVAPLYDRANILRAKLQDYVDGINAIADREVNKLVFIGIVGPAAVGGGLAVLPALAAGGMGAGELIGSGIAIDYGQAAGRGLLDGSLEMQSTGGGTALSLLTNGALGERAYGILSLGFGLGSWAAGRFGSPISSPAAESGGSSLPAVFDGELATRQLLGTTTTPGGRQIMFHAADRMVHPPTGRVPMTPTQVDEVLDGATRVVKREYHPIGNTLTIENANMPGRPRVIVDEATGRRIITVINPRGRR